MKLIENTITQFTNELASSSPAPGGGSTAAVEAGFGSGLIAMVCELTLSNKKYSEFSETVNSIKQQANNNKDRLLEIVDEDTEAFNMVSAAFGLPKESDEEKAIRRNAIQEGLKSCCIPPLNVMEKAHESLLLAKQLITNYNTNTASDLGTGIVSLRSAAQGAYFNVLINANSIKDEEYVKDIKNKADTLYKDILELSDELYKKIIEELA